MAPLSRFASSLKLNVAYWLLTFCAVWKKQRTLTSYLDFLELERGIEPRPPPYHGTQGEPRVLDDLTTCLTTC